MPIQHSRRWALWTASWLIGALALGACSTGAGGGSDERLVTSSQAVTNVDADQRGEPVVLSGSTLDQESLSTADFVGDPVVINIWGSWCAPCRKEAPDLQEAWEQLEPTGVHFVGLNVRDPDPAPAQAFVRSFGLTYPSIRDEDGSGILALRGAASPNAIPTTLILDEQGRIAVRVSGIVDTSTLVGLVDDLKAESGS